jgi:phospholipid/cholesterol/gamma-HCH transport system permease protein
MSKAPIFGLAIALIGCRQGLLVGGSVQSLGEHTTRSVVQAIFAIIVIDAVFAIIYMEMGV